MKLHNIELSTKAVLATRKIFNLTESDLVRAGFDEEDIEAFGEVYLAIKEQVENLEMTEGI